MPTYFVTGANRGLGRAAVTQLLEDPNNRVIATCRRAEDIPELTVSRNPQLVVLRLDYSDKESLKTLAAELEALQWGIDVFVANAAANNARNGVLESSPEEHIHFFTVNALGPVETFKVIRPYMERCSTRKVVFVSSILGAINEVPAQLVRSQPCAPYCVSKAALNMFTKQLSWELSEHGFIVVSYHPGIINTKVKSNTGKVNDDVSIAHGFVPDEEFIWSVTKDKLSLEEGVKRQLRVIDGLSQEHNGKFLTHTGNSLSF